MNISATELKNHLGQYLESSLKGPVIVEKSGRPAAVVISYEQFETLSHYEDYYWGMLATQSEKEGYLGVRETEKRLKSYAKRVGLTREESKLNKAGR